MQQMARLRPSAEPFHRSSLSDALSPPAQLRAGRAAEGREGGDPLPSYSGAAERGHVTRDSWWGPPTPGESAPCCVAASSFLLAGGIGLGSGDAKLFSLKADRF